MLSSPAATLTGATFIMRPPELMSAVSCGTSMPAAMASVPPLISALRREMLLPLL